jgi:hypothetical protein
VTGYRFGRPPRPSERLVLMHALVCIKFTPALVSPNGELTALCTESDAVTTTGPTASRRRARRQDSPIVTRSGRVPTNPGGRRDPAGVDRRRRSGRRVRKMACRRATTLCPVLACAAACLAPEARWPVRAATAYGENE